MALGGNANTCGISMNDEVLAKGGDRALISLSSPSMLKVFTRFVYEYLIENKLRKIQKLSAPKKRSQETSMN